jgi:hypothetical protein
MLQRGGMHSLLEKSLRRTLTVSAALLLGNAADGESVRMTHT